MIAPAARPLSASSLMLARILVRQAERSMVRSSDAVLVRGNSAHRLVNGPVASES